MKPQNYVLGFLFSKNMARVLLVKKARPSWQAGLLNGIGGHVESTDNDIEDAMEREAEEEAGITPGDVPWHLFGEMTFRQSGARVFLFSGRDIWTNPGCDGCLIAPTPAQETEPICFYDWRPWEPEHRVIPNLLWLVPMACNSELACFDGPAILQFP